ncbi:virion structural protein [Aeromonas phage LAh10]|uniref:Putative tail fiber protein n=1 Tax=Aeromonas phage LAh10 TaxID=2591025 RepID=A0A514A1F5_9CAUD|nr:virion structural protein [Aeromonas phage LAh10]QDH47109.1 putative tail fiber protein [Aeromonas phage LAh10]
MANNSIKGLPVYPWNPFNDMTINEIKGEIVNVQPTPGGSIIIPRCAPFFARGLKVIHRASGRELELKKGEFSLLYPFGSFISRYSQLVYSGILINGVTESTNFELEYNTIGGDFVLDDVAYAQAVANTLTSPRRADWSELVNLPPAWPADPHDHPASDTFNYSDMIIALQSYIDAMTGGGNPESIKSLLDDHLKADLQDAHKATLGDLGIKNLQDWAMAKQEDIGGNSEELLVNINVLKAAIRQHAAGQWQ